MLTIELSDDPDIDHLKRIARRVQRAIRAGDPEGVALAARYGLAYGSALTLSAAQLLVARECGCRSWPELRRRIGC